MKPLRFRFPLRAFLLAFCLLPFALPVSAATFSGNARLEVPDSTGGLSWNPTASALTVECWFKISIPSGTNLTENMTILVNRRSGSQSDTHGYAIYFNIFTGNVEFSARGSGAYTNTLISRPYLDRWYHVAVVRQGEVFTAYADGRQVFSASGSVGNAANTDGLSIGGWGSGKYLFGEVQEVTIYQRALDKSEIVDNLFADQSAQPNLMGYFNLAASTNTADQLKNFAPSPPSGTATLTATGPVTFDETDAAGEQSTYDARRNGGRDALVPLSGAFAWEQTALARPTPGIAFDFRFGYSSANSFGGYKLGSADPFSSGPLGPGWRHTFETRLLQAQDFDPSGSGLVVGLMSWSGAIETWDRQHVVDPLDTNSWSYGTNFVTRHKEYRGELFELDPIRYQWTTPDRLIYLFRHPLYSPQVMRGRLMEIRDFNSNSVQLRWNQSVGVLTQVVDTVRGTFDLKYDARQVLTNITFGAWQVNFGYDVTNRLISKTLTNTSGLYAPVNTTWQFTYNATNGLLERILDPRGNTNILVQYDQYGRKTNAVDALGRATRTEYNVPANRQIRNTDAAGFQWLETYDRKGHILAQQDPLANTTSYTYDGLGNRTSMTEPLGWTMLFGYDDRANVVARTNALGEVTSWTIHSFFNKAIQQFTPQPPDANGWTTWTNFYAYDAGGNLTNHSDALGSLVRYTYTTNGLVLTSTDANGNVSRFGYDTNGFLTSRTDPATNTTSFVVNDVGWKLREVNPLGDTTAYTLNVNGNPIRVQDVLGRVFNRTYDGNGNLLSTTDGKGQLTSHAYDAANQRTNTTDRTGTNQWPTFYTLRGKVDRVTDPLGNSATNFYDAANRLIRVTDPLGNSVTNQYDANGNLVALFDKLGQRWTKACDRLNRVIAEADPLGNTSSTTYDVAGRLLQTTTPNGHPTLHAYDGRGRLIKWHDAEGFDWLYAYDGVANITNITDALGGHYVMMYSNRNERVLERNQDGKEWRYAYDELLRLKQQTDPNGTTRTPRYDKAGRVLFVDFSTGRSDEFRYDDNDNPRTIFRRQNNVTMATTGFDYDVMDRLTNQTGVASLQHVQYLRDALGRITTLIYPNSKALTNRYDALNRLTNQVDWAGRQMTYQYDQADRLIRRVYPNGVSQTNTFDTAGRLTGLTHSSLDARPSTINVALTYAYDRNGNKTDFTEKGTLDWPLPSLTDETSRFTASGRLTDRTIATNALGGPSSTSALTYAYDASGNMTNAVGNGQSWSLTYDEDNRTTSLHWDCGLTAKTIVNRYDALGRRIERTVDGERTSYVLDVSGGMERILFEQNPDLTQSYYIHGPDLCYKVSDDPNGNEIATCYHADAQANIIALTGANGTNLAQYAYTPYGRSLAGTNSQFSTLNPQPFLFVGSQGVMEELPGLYFMRARYYSAEAGVFLSTDPAKNTGPGWKPCFYSYANQNPLSATDPNGNNPLLLGLISLDVDLVQQWGGNIINHGYHIFDYQFRFGEMAAAAGVGAVSPLIAEAGLSTVPTLLLLGTVSAGGNAWAQRADNGSWENGDLFSLGVSFVMPAVSGGFDKYGPKISNEGSLYFGKVPGPGFGQSHIVNSVIGETVSSGIESGLNKAKAVFSAPGGANSGGSAGGGAGGGGGGASMANYTAAIAGPYCSAVNLATSTKSSNPTTQSGTTTTSGGMCVAPSSNSGGATGNSGRSGTSAQTPNTTAQTSPTSIWSSVVNYVTSAWSSFTSHFGGKK